MKRLDNAGSGTGSRRGSSAGRRITDRLITLILVAAMVVGGERQLCGASDYGPPDHIDPCGSNGGGRRSFGISVVLRLLEQVPPVTSGHDLRRAYL